MLSAATGMPDWATPATMRTKPTPSAGEALPIIGLGTSRVFNIGSGESECSPRY